MCGYLLGSARLLRMQYAFYGADAVLDLGLGGWNVRHVRPKLHGYFHLVWEVAAFNKEANERRICDFIWRPCIWDFIDSRQVANID